MEIRHILGIVATIGYIAFANRERLKTLAKSAFATLSPMVKGQSRGWLIPLAIGGVVLWPDIAPHIPWPSPVVPTPIVERNDPLTKAQAAQRSAEIAMLRELAADTSPNTQAKLDKVVGLRDAIRLQTQSVYTDAIAEAVLSNGLLRLADEIEGPKQ